MNLRFRPESVPPKFADEVWSLTSSSTVSGFLFGLGSCQVFWSNDVRGFIWGGAWLLIGVLFGSYAARKEVHVLKYYETHK